MKKLIILISFLVFIVVDVNYAICGKIEKYKKSVVVVGNNINVRKNPTTTSPIVYQLKIAERVKIIKRSSVVYSNKQVKGIWVYIDTEYTKVGENESIKGWVVDYFLAKISSFKKVNDFISCGIDDTIGDWHMKYDFYKNGTYRREDRDYNSKKEYLELEKFLGIAEYFLKDDDGTSVDYFYYDKNGLICHYQRDLDGKSICTKCPNLNKTNR